LPATPCRPDRPTLRGIVDVGVRRVQGSYYLFALSSSDHVVQVFSHVIYTHINDRL
jgi:hypothetical protein